MHSRRQIFSDYAGSLFCLRLNEITTDDIEKILIPIWVHKNPTAQRLLTQLNRLYITANADFGKELNHNPVDVPVLKEKSSLPKLPRKIIHMPSLNSKFVPQLMYILKKDKSIASLAAQFIILSAGRATECLLSEWDFIDWQANTITFPQSNTKTNIEHIVPITPTINEIFETLSPITGSTGFIFKSSKKTVLRVSSQGVLFKLNQARLTLEAEIGSTIEHFTTHGFRASFKSWAVENSKDYLAVEYCLSHYGAENDVASRYNRSKLDSLRKEIMFDWDKFCCSEKL